ncbi:hypothetical protein EFN61_05350 [Leuconostoc citreum]|nr:hypothetical protein [Leuconostoc citreum]
MSNNAVNNLNFTAGLDTDLDSDDQVPIISDGNGGSFIQTPGADGLTLWNEPIAGLTQYVGDYWDDYNIDSYVAAAGHAKGSILKQDVDTAIAYTTGKFNLSPDEQKVISWQERLYTDGDDPINTSKVTAKYVDENSNMIADDIIKAGNVGDHYTTEQKAIAGYTFKKVEGPATGNFTNQEQTVTYVKGRLQELTEHCKLLKNLSW